MSEPVSSRAQAILDAVERAAAEHSAAAQGIAPRTPPPSPPVALPPEPPAGATPAKRPSRTDATDRLLALVKQTVTAIEITEAQHTALRREIDELQRRAAAPPAQADLSQGLEHLERGPAEPATETVVDIVTEPEQGPEPDPEPEAGLPRASAADILRAAGHERANFDGSPPRGAPASSIRSFGTGARPLPPKSAERRQGNEPVLDASVPTDENLSSTARLVAIEMAVSGGTRLQVEKRLHDEFGIADTHAIVDDVFGPDTAPGTRMPWGRRP